MTRVALFGVGSTNFHYTVGTPEGDFVTAVSTEPTRPHALETQLIDTLETRLESESLDAVAISAPGLVDPESGCISAFDTPDGALIEHLDLSTPIERRFGLETVVENDCSASALGEWYFGQRSDVRSLLHVTFGTGIGGGVVEDGRLVRGEHGQAGEFGLLPIEPEGPLESAAVTGAWEAYCSGRGIPQYVAHRLENGDGDGSVLSEIERELTAQDVFDAASDGDRFATDCLDRIARYNAAGIGTLCNSFNPGRVTVGGGVALNNADWLLEGIDRYLERYCFVDRPELEITPLGTEIGLYGALGVYRKRLAGSVGQPTTEITD
ncbi:ROK family protein [Natronosalvus vescus]|uniref:ROK family protein n=1 Tax=Natronosalvus vescus TaxID=2953881 RepID=UPI00209116AE|nr:ROK family protein [Natronosalvus vescus]